MNKKLFRIAGSALISLLSIIASIYLSTKLHYLLSGKVNSFILIPISQCIESICRDKPHQMLFLCMSGFSILLGVAFYLSNSKPYQSDLIEVTPGIETPVVAGQKQHGSATWLTEKDLRL